MADVWMDGHTHLCGTAVARGDRRVAREDHRPQKPQRPVCPWYGSLARGAEFGR